MPAGVRYHLVWKRHGTWLAGFLFSGLALSRRRVSIGLHDSDSASVAREWWSTFAGRWPARNLVLLPSTPAAVRLMSHALREESLLVTLKGEEE